VLPLKKYFMDISKKIEIANHYKFFADCFYYPDENQLELINNYNKKLSIKIVKISEWLDKEKELQVDFSKLFLGPFKVLAPPYGSVYLEEGKTIQGESTLDAIRLYQEEGLKVDLKEPADHIAIELEFMYYLISKEIEAIENNDLENANLYLNKQSSFIQRHLSKWVPEFTNLICTNAKLDFYKKIATSLNLMIEGVNVYKVSA
jgi:putative dimethyl sulfoxide reductase chaperone